MILSRAYLEHEISGPLARLLPTALTTLLLAAIVITLVALKAIPSDRAGRNDAPRPTYRA
ncbi:MAG: hypothetical protein EXR43_02320 [Dehalococcoidia bacterium]|nr:hypothetical protein [Dehalococcoidia bacterium]